MISTGYSAINDPNGGYLITGRPMDYGAGNGDILLIKTDTFGGVTWAKTFLNSLTRRSATRSGILVMAIFLISGYSNNSSTDHNLMFVKVDDSETIASKVYGTSNSDVGITIVGTPDSSIYLAGFTYNICRFSKYRWNSNQI